MSKQKKITVYVPAELLRDAQDATQSGTTETVRRGLEVLAAAKAFEGLRGLRGKVKYSLKLSRLRED
jgi:hypothetical protein